MKRRTKAFAILLALILLLSTMPALAANEQASEPVCKQISGNTTLYAGAGNKTSKVQTLAKNTVVLAFEAENGYTRVQVGNKEGYLSSKTLKAVNADATIINIVQANNNANLLSTPDVKGKKTGQLAKGDITASLLVIGNFTAVRQGSLIGFVATKELTVYSESSKAKGYLLYSKAADILAGSGAKDKKLATIAAGDLVEQLFLSGSTAVVRRGKVIGVASAKNAAVYNELVEAIGLVQATGATPVYAGASTKAIKVGNLKKNDIVEKLGVYGSYTIVRAEGIIGLVATKSLVAVQQGLAPAKTDSKPVVYPEITTKTIVVSQDVAAYRNPNTNEKFTILSQGTECDYIETTKDGGWVKVKQGGEIWYIERQYVKEPSAVQAAKQNTAPSTSSLPAVTYQDMALEFIDIMNDNRMSVGQKPLKVDDTLMRAAAIRAQELVTSFAHIRPNGLEPNSVHSMITGENIARGSLNLLPDAQSMADGFMGSSEHKKNAMSANFTKTGAYYVVDSGRIYWVHLFAA